MQIEELLQVQVGKLESIVDPVQAANLIGYERTQKELYRFDNQLLRIENQKENELIKKEKIEQRQSNRFKREGKVPMARSKMKAIKKQVKK